MDGYWKADVEKVVAVVGVQQFSESEDEVGQSGYIKESRCCHLEQQQPLLCKQLSVVLTCTACYDVLGDVEAKFVPSEQPLQKPGLQASVGDKILPLFPVGYSPGITVAAATRSGPFFLQAPVFRS
jgi:hypothetical protein